MSYMPIWCFIIVYINGTKLNFGETEMTSQAYAPIWHDGPCLPRLQPECDFFATGSQGFSVRKLLRTIFHYLILYQGLGLKVVVLYSAVSSLSDRSNLSKRCTRFALPGRPVHSDTNSASPGSILAMQQLRATTKSLTFPPLSVARYSFIQLSQLGRQWRERKCSIFEMVAKGNSNPRLARLRVRHSTTELPCSTLRCCVTLTVTITPNNLHMLRASLSETTGFILFMSSE